LLPIGTGDEAVMMYKVAYKSIGYYFNRMVFDSYARMEKSQPVTDEVKIINQKDNSVFKELTVKNS
jgi:hypothetical protein